MIAFYISIVCRQQIIDNNMAARFPSHKFSNITIYSVQTYIYKPRQKNSLNINSLLFQSEHTCIYILTKTKHFQEINSLYSLILQSVHTFIRSFLNIKGIPVNDSLTMLTWPSPFPPTSSRHTFPPLQQNGISVFYTHAHAHFEHVYRQRCVSEDGNYNPHGICVITCLMKTRKWDQILFDIFQVQNMLFF